MSSAKFIVWASVFAVSVGACRADVWQIQKVYQSILSDQDESWTIGDVDGAVSDDAIQGASEDEIRSLLPLGQKCLHSPKVLVRGAGLYLFLGIIVSRLDGPKLIEPYTTELAALLDDPDQGARRGASAILGLATNLSPQVLVLIDAHLHNSSNDAETARQLAIIELANRGASAVPAVLALVQERPELEKDVIEMLGVDKITSDAALKFIHAGFNSQEAATRLGAVEAIGRMPADVRKGFEPDLLRLFQNPDEDPRITEKALQVYLLK